MNNKLLKGLIAAPFTPMAIDGSINLAPIESYAAHLIKSKVSGVFVCGTTGESPSLTTEERKAILEEWIKCSDGKLKVICHVGGNSLPQSIELAIHAGKAGADAIGAFSPFFFKPATPKDLLSFLAPIANSVTGLPFYYYHMPSLTGVQFPVSDLLPEARKMIPAFAGVKYTHSDLYDMQRCLAYNNGEFEILHGYDEVLLAGLSLGIQAAIGSTYNYIPSLYLDIWKAYEDKDIAKARELQLLSVKIVQILNRYGGAIRAGKVIMEFIGLDCGVCRLPIPEISPVTKESLQSELKGIFPGDYLVDDMPIT